MLTLRLLVSIICMALAGCQCSPPLPGDTGAWNPVRLKWPPDAAVPPVDPPPADAGIVYSGQWAGEACEPQTYVLELDAGLPDGSVIFGVCAALRTLSGVATLNAQPAQGDTTLRFEAGGYDSEAVVVPDGVGNYEVRVLRARYDILKYHPSGIFPTHEGFGEFGVVDLTQNRRKDVELRSHTLRGSLTFGGIPWKPLSFPLDVQISAHGIPANQSAATANRQGAYEVGLIEGTFGLTLSVPRDALGETELMAYPMASVVSFQADVEQSLTLPATELEGQLTIDGQPFPNRRVNSFDYQLEWVISGGQATTVRTFHEGGTPDFHALVPKNKYSVSLRMESSPDRQFPSMVYNKQLSASVDLTSNAQANFRLTTHSLEGAITVDGATVKPISGYNWFLLMYGLPSVSTPFSLAYYEVPLDSAAFRLRAFPGRYYVALFVEQRFHPDLVEGWFLIDREKVVNADSKLPIDILTSPFEGRLTIDGEPPPAGQVAGMLEFEGPVGFYRSRLVTDDAGNFRLRVPQGIYDVYFRIDTKLYPQHATGRQRLLGHLELDRPQLGIPLVYDTVPVVGPLRVGGDVVPDTIPGKAEVGLLLRRALDNITFTWDFDGGPAHYVMRIPRGEYYLTFRIEKEALPQVAWGTAPMGVKVNVHAEKPP